MNSKNMASNTQKHAQQEMVGFVLIVTVVIVGLMVFLIISLNDSNSSGPSVTADNLLSALMRYTTDCAIVFEPQYEDMEGLFKSCHKNKRCSNLDTVACEYLNQTLILVTEELIKS